MVFERQFWRDQGQSEEYLGGNLVTGLPIKISYYPNAPSKSGTVVQKSKRLTWQWLSAGVGVLLASYTWGEDSERLQAMADNDLIQECLLSLSRN